MLADELGVDPGRSCVICSSASSTRIPRWTAGSSGRPAVRRGASAAPTHGADRTRNQRPDSRRWSPTPRWSPCSGRAAPARPGWPSRSATPCAPRSDGVWFVDLASIGDDGLLAATLAGTLGLADRPGVPALDVVTGFLADRRALLVVDNCEHLSPPRPCGRSRSWTAAHVRVLATTREPLDFRGSASPCSRWSGWRRRCGGPRGAVRRAGRRRDRPQRHGQGTGTPDLRGGRWTATGHRTRCRAAAHVRTRRDRRGTGTQPRRVGRRGTGRSVRPRCGTPSTGGTGWPAATSRSCTVGWPSSRGRSPWTSRPPYASSHRSGRSGDGAGGGLVHRSLLTSSRPGRVGGPTTFSQLMPIRAHAAEALQPASGRQSSPCATGGSPSGSPPLRWTGAPGRRVPRLARRQLRDAARDARLDPRRPPGPGRCGIAVSLVGYWFERGRLAEAAHWTALLRASRAGSTPTSSTGRWSTSRWGPCWRSCIGARRRHRSECGVGRTDLGPRERQHEVAQALTIGAAAAWTGDIWSVADEYACRAVSRPGRRPAAPADRRARDPGRNLAVHRRPAAGVAEARLVLRDETLGNDVAALFALVVLTVAALRGGDPAAALRSSDALLLAHRRMGTLAVADTIETRAAIRAAAGDLGEAVRCLGASAALSRRLGRDWPWHETPRRAGRPA